MQVKEIEIDKIVIPEQRARATFTDEQYAELKASIEKNGFTVPILVKPLEDGRYELIDGEHRIKVVQELGWTKVPAVVTDADEKKASLLNILANTARGTQNPMDVAEALKRAYDAGADIKELAAATGHTENWVKLYLTLNELPDHYKEALRNGQLKVGHIQEAMKLPNPVEIDAALQSCLVHNWSVSVLRYYVEQRLREIEIAKQKGDQQTLEAPPTPQYAQELVSYGDCMVCKRKVNRNDLSMPTICEDCRVLLEWIIDQLGDPKQAMQTIYNALSLYYDFRSKTQTAKVQNPNLTQIGPQGSVQQQVQNPNQMNPSSEIDQETLALAKKLKEIKEAGLL